MRRNGWINIIIFLFKTDLNNQQTTCQHLSRVGFPCWPLKVCKQKKISQLERQSLWLISWKNSCIVRSCIESCKPVTDWVYRTGPSSCPDFLAFRYFLCSLFNNFIALIISISFCFISSCCLQEKKKKDYSKEREGFTRINVFNKMRVCEEDSECSGQK